MKKNGVDLAEFEEAFVVEDGDAGESDEVELGWKAGRVIILQKAFFARRFSSPEGTDRQAAFFAKRLVFP